MSRIGHRAVAPTALGTVVTSWDLEPGVRFDQHQHPSHQLSIAARSAVAMVIGERTYVVPRARALWVPAGTPHSVAPLGAAQMTTLWFDPARCPLRWSRPTVVNVDGLVEALLDRLRDGSLSAAARTRSERVLFDALHPVPASDLDLALPTDDRARRVAEAILLDPSDNRTLAAWGRLVGASERTLMRRFQTETGRGFQDWRTAARLLAALRLLLTDAPVASIAGSVGYSNASAFCAAFRRTLGAPPSAFRSS